MRGLLAFGVMLAFCGLLAQARAGPEEPKPRSARAASRRPPPPDPKDNPTTKDKVALGKLLFFEKRMSLDGTVSCATCHNPQKGWTDQRPTPVGVRQQLGHRNTPTVLNAAYHDSLFWDGRAPSLEEQAKGPITHPKEMGLTLDEATGRLAAIPGYARYFKAAFGAPKVSIERILRAVSSFERTLLTGNSPFDRYLAGDRAALKPEAARGLELFQGKANCTLCHFGPDMTDGRFHNVGAGMERRVLDLGRHDVTKEEKDRGAFKTPVLRNLSDTAPYMHDGSQATLKEVVEYFDKGGYRNPGLSPDVKPLGLTEQERQDLLAFLESLNGERVIIEEPKRFPQ